MSQNAVLTQGTQLKRGDGGSPEVFTLVPDTISIAGPDASKAEIDVTDLMSAAKEYKGGLADFGRMSVEINYIPGNAVHTAIRNDFVSASSPTRNWQVIFTNGKTWTFNAFISAFPGNIAADSVVKGTMTLRMSGQINEA